MKKVFKIIIGGVGALAGIGAIVSALKKDKPEESSDLDEVETEAVSDEE